MGDARNLNRLLLYQSSIFNLCCLRDAGQFIVIVPHRAEEFNVIKSGSVIRWYEWESEKRLLPQKLAHAAKFAFRLPLHICRIVSAVYLMSVHKMVEMHQKNGTYGCSKISVFVNFFLKSILQSVILLEAVIDSYIFKTFVHQIISMK